MNARRVLLLGGAVFAASFSVPQVAGKLLQDHEPKLDLRPIDGREVALVLLVSPTCAGCNDPRLPWAWAEAVEYTRIHAETRDVRMSLTGIGVSGSPEAGIAFLNRFGHFHELIIGRGWSNTGTMRFVFEKLRGPAVVPQIIVLERRVEDVSRGRIVFYDEQIVQRRVGLDAITRWAEELEARVPARQ